MDEADVVVVGAGIVGLSAARALAAAGARVLVVDRGQPGAEASSAAAGWLAAQAETEPGSPLLDLALHARARHQPLAAELEDETGIDVGLSTRGTIEVAFSEEEVLGLLRRLEWQQALGLPAESMGADAVRRAEPNVNPTVRGGLLLAQDRSIDNVRLTRALAASAVARGAGLLSGQVVATLVLEEGRVAGVRAGQEILRAPVVIEAMGAWSALLGGDPSPPPVEPVRGQIVCFERPGHLSHVVCTTRGYIVPRADGRLLAGSTTERAGYEKSVTPAGLEAIRRIALEIAPGLAEARVADSWAGLRPGTPDGLPIIGPGAVPGLLHATGLYRSGILLGPLVGEAAARMALGADPGIDLSPFSPSRFRSA
jgi:glycine oxidase